jgi:opacity protein-like surface antigen
MKLKALAVLLLLLASTSLFAQDRNVRITVWGSQVDMEGDNDLDGFTTEFDDGGGLGASVNWNLGRFLSIEGAAFGLRTDAGLLFDGSAPVDLGSLNLTPLMAGVQVHPLGNTSRFDVYAGAGGAYVIADDFNSRDLDTLGLGRIELDSDLTYFINAGIGFQITEGFGIALDARQIAYEPTSRSSVTGVEQELDLTPRIYSAGLRLRF